jgi:hypothetical protein
MAALSFVCLAGAAGAASYNVAGTYTYEIQNPGTPWSAVVVPNPSIITFTSGATPWHVEVEGPDGYPLVSGAFHLAPYALEVDFGDSGKAALTVPARTVSFSQEYGSPYYVEATRTLNALVGPWLATSPGQQCEEASDSAACSLLASPDLYFYGGFAITFDDDTFTTFTGQAVVYQLLDSNYNAFDCFATGSGACAKNTFVFTASAVPVPAAGWLLASGLAVLLGATRRQLRAA